MKILWSGDSPGVPTGFGVVSRNILNRLAEKGYDIEVLAINFFGDPYDRSDIHPNIKVWPVDKGATDQQYGYAKLWWIEKKVNPDLIFFLNDPWIIHRYMEHKLPDATTRKFIAYYPTDASPIKKEWIDTLNKMDAQVCYSHYAEDVVTFSNGGVKPPNLHQIYHGVDTQTFHPVNQNVARANLGIPLDAFVVGMVARNQFRKRFDLLVKGFAEFAKDKPEAKLYLHTALKDVGFDIQELCQQFNIGSKLILTQNLTPAEGVPKEFLNMIYNTFDVNALISLGDGFGLPVAESMATGCPQLVSGHSCLKELVDGPQAGLLVNTAAWILNTNGLNTWGGVSDADDITTKLNILYNNRELRVKMGENAYKHITQPQYDWNVIAEQFHQLIKQVFHII